MPAGRAGRPAAAEAPRHVVLASVGSLGDVHPFLAIGTALRRRGHAVTLICNDDHAEATRAAGLDHAPTGPAVDLRAAAASPNLWHPIKGLGVFWRHMLAPSIAPTFRHIERIAARGRCIVVAPPVMFGARYAREACGVPLLSAITAPAVLRTDRAPVTMAHWRLPVGTPAGLVRLAWQALDRHKLHPMAQRVLRREAEALGVSGPPDGTSVFGQWMLSPDGALALFPEWYAPRRPGWPTALRYGGFPLYDDDAGSIPGDARTARAAAPSGDANAEPLPVGSGVASTHDGLPEAVERFLGTGTPPIVFMPGSAMQHGAAFFAAAVDACRRLDRRALLLTPHAAQLPATLPDGVLAVPYAPFGALLPRAAALVHHGGIGSCAQALRAGLPQLAMPMAHDQFDNAECLRRLGVGAALRPQRFDGARLAASLRRVLALPAAPREACRDRLATPALPALCDAIEAMAR